MFTESGVLNCGGRFLRANEQPAGVAGEKKRHRHSPGDDHRQVYGGEEKRQAEEVEEEEDDGKNILPPHMRTNSVKEEEDAEGRPLQPAAALLQRGVLKIAAPGRRGEIGSAITSSDRWAALQVGYVLCLSGVS